MIVGILLRYIKTYRGINYIPLTDEDNFCGLVGDNGIGKSSILEALDALFNEKTINLNIATKKSGLVETSPIIVPIFLIKRTDVTGPIAALANSLSHVALTMTELDTNSSYKAHVRRFIAHREALVKNINIDDYFLLPIGISHDRSIALSFFNNRKLVEAHIGPDAEKSQTSLNPVSLSDFTPLLQKIREQIEYIYIPKEIDSEAFTKLETAEIQALMGETLNQILEERVTASTINDINKNLNSFIETLSSELEVYSYRTRTDRQQNLKKNDVYNLIIQAFFNIRKLHKKQGENWLDINSLSSGEKQKAIIDVAHSLIKKHRSSGDNLIIAIDEPESSLHMSACFDQFDALYDISRSCRQLLFSTHWYGFFPTIESGSASIITKSENEHNVDLINLSRHREQVKQLSNQSKGSLPYDVRLKSINDFVQSIISSAMGENPFSWLICEGSSERIYLSKYLAQEIKTQRLRIVPVGGAKEIKRLYNHLAVSYEDFKDEITGKIILISDTDADLVSYETKNLQNLICKRMVNDPSKRITRLINISSNPVSPPTEIEDSLDGPLFFSTLTTFAKEWPPLSFLTDLNAPKNEPSYFAADLRHSEREAITNFFDSGNHKYEFAKRYSEQIDDSHQRPSWINEIVQWLN